MKREVGISSIRDLDRAAKEFLAAIGERKLIAFYGCMGAGKTTFTAALCKALGVEDKVCSPTFTIVNEYLSSNGKTVYHFDFYRIRSYAEALDAGIEDYFYSGCLCLMEWPENVEGLLPEETLKVRIAVNPDSSRSLVWEDE